MRTWFLLALAAGSLACAEPAAGSWQDISWFDDAAGYAQAVAKAEAEGKPVFVYFYTEWCPYCRQLNAELLAAAEVQEEIDRMIAVRVNAEGGPDERSLAAHYRVRGYPALFVFTANARSGYPGGDFQPIRRTVGGAEGVRLKTPAEFVATLRAAGR
ncbi:MAG: thioredoxin family protein [Acidobacteriota bacterium]|nr:thioredoxin family protein [Acidobacteriota bacterium]MDH3524265.1 thioredoxin family protein [Acidobacteriota bacterium]